MTKAEVVSVMAKEAKVSKVSAEKALNAYVGAVTKALKKGEKFSLPGYMTFSIGKRKARTGRNPKTGAAIKIPAAKVVKFKAGSLLKKALN